MRIYTEAGGKLQTDTKVIDIMVREGHVYGVRTVNGVYEADRVILAAGGASYPAQAAMAAVPSWRKSWVTRLCR